jgi:hypothetical protein
VAEAYAAVTAKTAAYAPKNLIKEQKMKNNVFKVILKWFICGVVIFLGFWFALPPLNL